MTKQCSLIVVPSPIRPLHTTLHALKSSESIRRQVYARLLLCRCRLASHGLPWQQQTSQLQSRKIKQSVLSGERDMPLRLMIQWVHRAIAIASCRRCNAAGGSDPGSWSTHHLTLPTSSAPCLHGVCRTSLHFCVIGVVDKLSVSKIGTKTLNWYQVPDTHDGYSTLEMDTHHHLYPITNAYVRYSIINTRYQYRKSIPDTRCRVPIFIRTSHKRDCGSA